MNGPARAIGKLIFWGKGYYVRSPGDGVGVWFESRSTSPQRLPRTHPALPNTARRSSTALVCPRSIVLLPSSSPHSPTNPRSMHHQGPQIPTLPLCPWAHRHNLAFVSPTTYGSYIICPQLWTPTTSTGWSWRPTSPSGCCGSPRWPASPFERTPFRPRPGLEP